MRIPNWPAKLAETIDAWRDRQFEWGRSDCCQFFAEVSLAISGEDPRSRVRAYDSEIGAARLIAQHGGMEGLLTHALGEPKPVAYARRGDIVLCEFGSGPQPAVVEGVMCCAPSAQGGLARRRVLGDRHYPDAVLAWSIG